MPVGREEEEILGSPYPVRAISVLMSARFTFPASALESHCA